MRLATIVAALKKYGSKMPENIRERHRCVVKKYLNGRDFTNEDLTTLSNIKHLIPNPSYIPPSERVISSLQSEVEMAAFVRSWRRFFIDAFEPRHMPEGWSVDSRVTNDGFISPATTPGGEA